MPKHRVNFGEVFRFRVPNGFHNALAAAAAHECTTSSELVRRAIVEKPRTVGVDLPSAATERRPNNDNFAAIPSSGGVSFGFGSPFRAGVSIGA